MLPRLQTGDVFALILRRKAELPQSRIDAVA